MRKQLLLILCGLLVTTVGFATMPSAEAAWFEFSCDNFDCEELDADYCVVDEAGCEETFDVRPYCNDALWGQAATFCRASFATDLDCWDTGDCPNPEAPHEINCRYELKNPS
jgi:hypothetical protein